MSPLAYNPGNKAKDIFVTENDLSKYYEIITEISLLNKEKEQLGKDNALFNLIIKEIQKELEDNNARLKAITEAKVQSEKELTSEIDKVKAENNKLLEENELIKIQLHQLQEQFEKLSLDIDQIKKEKQNLEKNLKEQIKDKTTLSSQYQEALNQNKILNDHINFNIIKFNKERSELDKKLKILTEAKVQSEKNFSIEIDKIKTEKNNISNENELIILQLHQLQEEFELRNIRSVQNYYGMSYKQLNAAFLYSLFHKTGIFSKVKLKLINDQIQITSILPQDIHKYFYAKKLFHPEELNLIFNKIIKLDCEADCDLRTVFVYLDENENKISHNITPAGKDTFLQIPPNCKRIKFAIRVQGSGKAIVKKLALCPS